MLAHIATHWRWHLHFAFGGPPARRCAGLTSFVGNLRPLGFRFRNIGRIDSPRDFRVPVQSSGPGGMSMELRSSYRSGTAYMPASLPDWLVCACVCVCVTDRLFFFCLLFILLFFPSFQQPISLGNGPFDSSGCGVIRCPALCHAPVLHCCPPTPGPDL